MRKTDLEPTDENIILTLKEDLLGRNVYLYRLAELCDRQEDSCVIALDGQWGSGKTFFVRQLQALMASYNTLVDSQFPSEEEKNEIKNTFQQYQKADPELGLRCEVVCYYDAWSNDNEVDPLLSLVYQISNDTEQMYQLKEPPDISNLAFSIIDLISGRDIKKFVNDIKLGNIVDVIQNQKNLHEQISEFIHSLIPEHGERLIIIIDELDRCRPDFAVQLLERVKHYFSDEQITFIFAINSRELQQTIKRYYGDGFDACRYLDRFFDYQIPLPKANMVRYYEKMGLNESDVFETVCKKVINYCHFDLREIGRFYRKTELAVSSPIHCSGKYHNISEAISIGFNVVVPIIIGLQMSDNDLYQQFINGENASPLISIIGDDRYALGYFRKLLDLKETYEEPKDDEVHVELKDKLQAYYDAVFKIRRDREFGETNVGKVCIRNSVKDTILDAASMISRFSDFDILG